MKKPEEKMDFSGEYRRKPGNLQKMESTWTKYTTRPGHRTELYELKVEVYSETQKPILNGYG